MSFGFATDQADCSCCACCPGCILPGPPSKDTLCGESSQVACKSYAITISGVGDGIGNYAVFPFPDPCSNCGTFNGTFILNRPKLLATGQPNCAFYSKFFPFQANIPCFNYTLNHGGVNLHNCNTPNPNPQNIQYGIGLDLFMCPQFDGFNKFGKYFIQADLNLICNAGAGGPIGGMTPITFRYYFNNTPIDCNAKNIGPLIAGILSTPIWAPFLPNIHTGVFCNFSGAQMMINPA